MFETSGIFRLGANSARRLWRNPIWLIAGAGGLVFLLGSTFLAGWALRIPALVRGQPGIDTVPPSGALGFLLCGAGLVAAALGGGRWAVLCGGGAALVGGTNLIGHLLGVGPVLDSHLFRLLLAEPLSVPGGMPPGGAVAFLVAGAGIVSAVSPLSMRWRLLVLGTEGAVVAITGVLARTGYIVQVAQPWDVSVVPGLPGYAALGFLVVGGSLFSLGIVVKSALPSPAKPLDSAALKSVVTIGPASPVLPLLGTGLLLGSIVVFLVVVQQAQRADEAVRHTLIVVGALGRIEKAAVNMQSGERGYVITGQETFLAPYESGSKDFAEAQDLVRRLTADNPEQQRHLEKVRSLGAQWVEYSVNLIALRKGAAGASRANELVSRGLGAALMDRLRAELESMMNEEIGLLAERRNREVATQTVLTVVLLFCVVAGILATMTQFLLARRLESQRRALVSEIAIRKEAEENLRHANQAVEAVNKELEAFSYSVSHDLRAPIRGMAGFSQILIEDFGPQLPQEAQDHLRIIQAEGQRMGQLIDDMLNLSRVTRTTLRRETVNLSTLASEVLATLRKSDPERKAECVVADGLTATGDARMLRILLDNLLGNAWKFTGRTAEPRIEFGSASANGGPAFYVRDNGAGFDMAYADKLFGAFQRLHSSNEFPGTGIGLAIVQRIANRHGGRVWAEGAKGQGATFYFSL